MSIKGEYRYKDCELYGEIAFIMHASNEFKHFIVLIRLHGATPLDLCYNRAVRNGCAIKDTHDVKNKMKALRKLK